MKGQTPKSLLLVLLSTLLFAVSLRYEIHILSWVCFVPVIYLLLDTKHSKKELLKYGFLNGIALGLLLFNWSVAAIEKYTDGQILLGILAYLLFTLFNGLVYAVTFWLFGMLRRQTIHACWQNICLLVIVLVLQDFCLELLFSGMPWLVIYKSYSVMSNLYVLQYASYGGVMLLSLLVVLVNAILAYAFISKRKMLAHVGISVCALIYVGGFLLFNSFNVYYDSVIAHTRIAILSENADPSIKWNDQNANKLVANLQYAHKQALQLQPDIILWTESAVPWTYTKDDDFLASIWYQQKGAPITNIIGMNTDAPNEKVYNSAYVILPTGLAGARYDKKYLLSLVEAPLSIFNLPFLGTDGFYAEAGDVIFPLPTPHGNAGVMICNESNVSKAAQNLVDAGADFLLNMSNDGWFADSKLLIQLHFLNARLRAVEQRRDMVVASNLGISGFINANGTIFEVDSRRGAYTASYYVKTLTHRSFYNKFSSIFY